MASARWEIMARSGPEDTLQAVQLPHNSSSQLTAGNDWAVARSKASGSLFYTDEKEAQRLVNLVESAGPESRILKDLALSRHVCTQPAFSLDLCKRNFREHQAKQCTPAYVEVLKCHVKMARAVDTICKPQFTSLAACLKESGTPSKCVDKVTAFDRCTEDF